MIPERYWSVTGLLDRAKLEELVAVSKGHGSDMLVTINVTGDVPVVTIGDSTYDGKSVSVEFYTGPE